MANGVEIYREDEEGTSMTAPSEFDQAAFGISAFLAALKDLIEILAVVVGAVWTYYKFFKGRTYQPRLECDVSGSIKHHSGRLLMKAVANLKNAGLSKVSIDRNTALQLFSAKMYVSDLRWPCHMDWERRATWDIFGEHEYVEPSETIDTEMLVELPNENVPVYKLTLKVFSSEGLWSKSKAWRADTVIFHDQGTTDIGGTCGEISRSEETHPDEILEIQKQKEEQHREEERRREEQRRLEQEREKGAKKS